MITANSTIQTDYDALRAGMQARFTKGPLFTTDAVGLNEAYLAHFSDEERQHHNCHACRDFIQTFGGLVWITPDGHTVPAMWQVQDVTAGEYCAPIAAMQKLVARAKVTGVFLSSLAVWGKPITGAWTHFAITPPPGMIYKGAVLTAEQAIAAKLQDYLTVLTALQEFSLAVVQVAVTILQSEALYRSEKCLGAAEWLLDLHQKRKTAAHGLLKDNLTWAAIAAAPAGFCHPRSSVIGTLLEDIQSGLDFDLIKRRFNEKMNPAQYQRPQAAPSAGNIAQAEKLVEKLGIAASLRRRFARIEDLQKLWSPTPAKQETPAGGVFGHLKPKGSLPAPTVEIPPLTMTWVKFAATVLPDAAEIAFRVPLSGNFTALLTAVDPAAPVILQWNNPVSWYVYLGGSPSSRWELRAGTDCPVTAMTLQPSMWDAPETATHHGESVILVLRGARDLQHSRGCGLGIFPETLRADLHAVRSTIEAFSSAGVLEGGEEATACGYRLQKGVVWNDCLLTVTSKTGSVLRYKLDRWD
jgi:membrane protein YqaA with SNARE-associated domain